MKKVMIIILTVVLISLWFILYEMVFKINITEFNVPDKLYIIAGEEIEIPISIKEKENKKVLLRYITSDKEIIEINDKKIKGLKDGKAKITVRAQNTEQRIIDVIVTSLITKPTLNNNKPYITCEEYTKEESDILESILESRINSSGYMTRGGALAAARFLLLEFKSGIKYYNENGRLENHSNIQKIDGEGRYYHKGLYLTKDKYKDIELSTEDGPKMWGCELKNLYYGKNMENGLDCSGFITWALKNAGYEVGDVGAGDYQHINNELLDLSPREKITHELLLNNKVKVGDLIGFDGHIAMIIGLEQDKIYIGESYETGLRVRTFTTGELIKSEFTDIILMDDYYKNEGNYQNMW